MARAIFGRSLAKPTARRRMEAAIKPSAAARVSRGSSGAEHHLIGSLKGLGSVAEDINDHGAIVGYLYITRFHLGVSRTYLWQFTQFIVRRR